ncbi:MAG: radical SAM protein [Clostridiaceae bacterium]|nr:radical SAM protein [Clostridiaceae bacterium]
MISFFLTTKCNLCCRYCYNAHERAQIKEQTLPLEIAKAGIDWYFAGNDSRHIRFYGPGEPTQEFDKLKAITAYAKASKNGGERVTTEIQTNGVFTEEVRAWVLDNLNIVWMSFDGMRDIQDYNRPLNPKYQAAFGGRTSAQVLEENVRWLIQNTNDRNLMVGARVTITDKNIDRQKEMVNYFYDLGIRYVWTNPLFYSVDKIPVCDDKVKRKLFSFDMDKYLDNYIAAYRYAKEKGLFWGSFLTVNFDGESAYHCRACTPMGAPHLTPDGYLSACDMVLMGTEAYHMEKLIYGKWNSQKRIFDIDAAKVAALRARSSDNIAHCKNCEARLHCGGYCLGEIVNETGELDGQKPIQCAAIKRLLKEIGTCEPYKYLHP